MGKIHVRNLIIAAIVGGIGLNLVLLPDVSIGVRGSTLLTFINGAITGILVQVIVSILSED